MPWTNENILTATPDHATQMTTKIKDVVIDTANTGDMGWETAIRSEKTDWIVVKRYNNQTEAKNGHQSYLKEVESGKRKFFSIQNDRDEEL